MRKPVIGIPEMGWKPKRIYMGSKYVFALLRAGARVRLLRFTEQESDLTRYVRICDGLLMPGGPDIDPILYGCTKEPGCGEINPRRDALELPLLSKWLETGKPVLGICRGIQVLGAVCGGTLHQDIQPAQKAEHSDYQNRAGRVHRVIIEQDSLLYDILGREVLPVNSIHHQAVKEPGRLRITARSEDGFAEGAELLDYGFCLGVQWHPEHLAAHDGEQQKLFDAFVAACRGD